MANFVSCEFTGLVVEFTPLPEEQAAAWWAAMDIIAKLIKQETAFPGMEAAVSENNEAVACAPSLVFSE